MGETCLILEIDVHADGSWRLGLRNPGSTSRWLSLGTDAVEALQDEVAALRCPPGLQPTEADYIEVEEATSRALFAPIQRDPGLFGIWSATLARARERDTLLVVAVLAPHARAARLPWELLGDGVPLEQTGHGVICRLQAGPPPPPAAPWTRRLWSGPGTADLTATLELALRDAGMPASDAPRLLLSATHGRLDDRGRLVLDRDHGPACSGSTAVQLDPAQLGLAVFLSCHTAGPQAGLGLTRRLLDAGCGAVIAPSGTLGLDAAEAFCAQLLPALAKGHGVARAVQAGRRAVARGAWPAADARWHRLQLHLTRTLGIADATWNEDFTGWPTPSASARLVLQSASRHARRVGLDFLGVEHLLDVYRDQVPDEALRLEPEIARRSAILRSGGAQWREGRWGLVHTGGVGAPKLTPRLQELGQHLSPGFDACELYEALVTVAEATALRWYGAPMPPLPDDILETHTHSFHGHTSLGTMGPVDGLECVGGPEDGRRLWPRPEQFIGRHELTGAPDLPLQKGPVRDPRLSRRHIRWLGTGEVRVLKKQTWLEPGHQRVEAGAPITLRHGQTLWLGGGTWLRAIGAPAHGKSDQR